MVSIIIVLVSIIMESLITVRFSVSSSQQFHHLSIAIISPIVPHYHRHHSQHHHCSFRSIIIINIVIIITVPVSISPSSFSSSSWTASSLFVTLYHHHQHWQRHHCQHNQWIIALVSISTLSINFYYHNSHTVIIIVKINSFPAFVIQNFFLTTKTFTYFRPSSKRLKICTALKLSILYWLYSWIIHK